MSKRLTDARVAQYQSDGYASPVDMFSPEETVAFRRRLRRGGDGDA